MPASNAPCPLRLPVLQGAASHAAVANLSMNASIQGLGPRFRLLLNLSNEGQDLATDLQVSLQLQLQCSYHVFEAGVAAAHTQGD
jgi:hypothetical protein